MVENVHLSKLIDMQARRLGNRVAIMYRDSCVEFWHEVACPNACMPASAHIW